MKMEMHQKRKSDVLFSFKMQNPRDRSISEANNYVLLLYPFRLLISKNTITFSETQRILLTHFGIAKLLFFLRRKSPVFLFREYHHVHKTALKIQKCCQF